MRTVRNSLNPAYRRSWESPRVQEIKMSNVIIELGTLKNPNTDKLGDELHSWVMAQVKSPRFFLLSGHQRIHINLEARLLGIGEALIYFPEVEVGWVRGRLKFIRD